MKSKIFLNYLPDPLQFIEFSDGTIQLKLTERERCKLIGSIGDTGINVTAHIKCAQGIIALAQVKEYYDQMVIQHGKDSINIDLHLPYIPYARYDRAMFDDDIFSLKIFTNILNSLEFDSVVVHDPHSTVSTALINNYNQHESAECQQHILVKEIVNRESNSFAADTYDAIISPDLGASKKAFLCAQSLEVKELIKCDKNRDPRSGEITSQTIYGDVKGKSLLIVDDIADGGYTFTQLAKLLKEQGAKKVDLYVTHGIFSKGLSVMYENIDNIYCYHLWSENIPNPEAGNILPVKFFQSF